MKRIVTIQDISCFGKCSLTVASPLISACGVEACVIPTAVLSTHTGGFTGYTVHDLTDDIRPIAEHWKTVGINFDGIYTGYLGSFEQLKIVADFIDDFAKKGTTVFIDPVMGDNGKLYAGFDKKFACEMAKLCAKADVITPNMTEAAFLLDEEYRESGYDEKYVKNILIKLASLGAKKVVLTGVSLEKDKLGCMGYDSEKDEFFSYFREQIHDSFHGTGDVFSSICVSSLIKGYSLEQSVKNAADFVVKCIENTANDKKNHWYSVKFEECIPYLINNIFTKENKNEQNF